MFVGCHRMSENSGVGLHNPFRIEFIFTDVFYEQKKSFLVYTSIDL